MEANKKARHEAGLSVGQTHNAMNYRAEGESFSDMNKNSEALPPICHGRAITSAPDPSAM
jgi:hypothetical protein